MPGRTSWAILVAVATAALIAPAAQAGRIKPGDPMPGASDRDIENVEESAPKDRRHYARPAIREDVEVATQALPPGWSMVDTVVANTDPNLATTDTAGDSEPSLALNGSNPNQMSINAFSSRWGDGNAVIWHTLDGGATWTRRFSWPQPTGVSVNGNCPCDVTLDYDRGGRLFGTVLNVAAGPTGDVYTGDSTDVTTPAGWQWFAPGGVTQKTDTLSGGANDADQPWLRVTRDPTNAAQDNVYVAYDDFTSPPTAQVAVAPGTAPPQFTRNQSPGNLSGFVNPGTRIAVDHGNGTVYAIWQFRDGPGSGGSQHIVYALNRSTDGGQSWSINGFPQGMAIAGADSTQPQPKFGTVNALLGGVDAAAVDSSSHAVYYAYGNRDSSTANNRLAIRKLTPNGTGGLDIGAEHFVTGQAQAALASVAVASNGTVGVLYDTFDGLGQGGFPAFTVHLAQSVDGGTSWTDTPLLSFLSPAVDNGDPRQRVLGDYHQLRSLGTRFYGTFSANGAAAGRSTSNIDPWFVSAPAAGGDQTAPTVKAPASVFASPLGGSSRSTTQTPIKTSWSATDASGVCSYNLQRSVNNGAYANVALPTPTTTSVTQTLNAGTRYKYRVSATDCANNTSSPVAALSFVPALRDGEPGATGVAFTGTWNPQTYVYAFNKTQRFTTAAGATVSFTDTARRIAYVARRGPDRGVVSISVDGAPAGTVDLFRTAASNRSVIFQRSFAHLASHTVTITNQATGGRPRIDSDAFGALK